MATCLLGLAAKASVMKQESQGCNGLGKCHSSTTMIISLFLGGGKAKMRCLVIGRTARLGSAPIMSFAFLLQFDPLQIPYGRLPMAPKRSQSSRRSFCQLMPGDQISSQLSKYMLLAIAWPMSYVVVCSYQLLCFSTVSEGSADVMGAPEAVACGRPGTRDRSGQK